MIPDYKPIIFNTPEEFKSIEVYFAHDVHCGSDLADMKKWERFKREILAEPNRYLIMAGDYCDTAIVGGKSDVYSVTESIQAQQSWLQQQLYDLKDRILCIVPGNHENRITKAVGLYPVYDAAVIAGVQDRYRQHFAFVDIGVGSGGHGSGKQARYFGYVTHRLKDCKIYHSGDFIDGVDFVASGHDHDPKDHARSKLVYDHTSKTVIQKDIEVIDSGSFLRYGGYGVDAGYRPQASKLYKIVLSGTRHKGIVTVGYHI